MRTVVMADATGIGTTPSQRAVNPNYRTSIEITSKRGGVFWGLVLLVLGVIWLIGSLGYISLDADLMLPLLVMLGGLYLLISKIGSR